MTSRQLTAYDPSASFEVEAFDVEYLRLDGEPFLARIHRPVGQGPFPALLSIHGGAWSGNDRHSNAFIDGLLAQSGLLLASIDFRLAPEHSYPAQVQDANYAIRWLKAHAKEMNGDPSTLGVIGRSSGGHTALLLALRPQDTWYGALPLGNSPDATVDYAIALWPVLDSYSRYLTAKERGATRLVEASMSYFLTEEAMQEGNPQGVLERGDQETLPPVRVLHGSADENVPIHLVERFAKNYRAAGGQIDLEVFPDQPHSFVAEPGPIADKALDLMRGFVRNQLAKR